jgi:hypothetical protein
VGSLTGKTGTGKHARIWKERLDHWSGKDDPKQPGYFGRMTPQQKRDKEKRDAIKTPVHEDSRYS